MIKTNFSIDSILGNKCHLIKSVEPFTLDGEDSSRSQYSNSPSSNHPSQQQQQQQSQPQPPSSIDKSKEPPPELKGPFCAKCKLHSEYFLVKNHKDSCKRRYCNCDVCKLIDEGKTLRGKKKRSDNSTRSDRFDRTKRTHEEIMTMAGNFKSDLIRFIESELGTEAGRMDKLLNSVFYLLLQRNGFDANTLKKKLSTAAKNIEDLRQGRNCNILEGINSFHGESSEVVGPSSPPLADRLTLNDRPRHLSSSSATTFSSQSMSSLSTSPNTIIIPANLPTPLLSSTARPGSLISPTGIPSGTGSTLTFAPTPLITSLIGSTNTSSGSSSASSISSSSPVTSVPISSAPSAAAAAAASSILSLTGTEYSVTAIPQPTMFTSSLFCPTYPYSPLMASGPLQAPYQTTINCPTGVIRSPPSSPVKSHFSPQHPGTHSPNSTIGSNPSSNFNRSNHNVSIQLADSIAKSNNHHHLHHQIHQHTTSLYSFLGSNSGAINLSKRLN